MKRLVLITMFLMLPALAQAATVAASAQTAWDATGTSKNTTTFSVLPGDVLVAAAIVGGTGAEYFLSPTGTLSATWTEASDYNTSGRTWAAVAVWYTSITTTQTNVYTTFNLNTGPFFFGGIVYVVRGATGIGTANKAQNTTGLPSVTLSGVAADSVIVMASGDWLATDNTTRAYNTSQAGLFTESAGGFSAGRVGYYTGYYADSGTAGSKTVGITAPAGQQWTIVAVEVPGSVGPPLSKYRAPGNVVVR